MFTSSSGRSVPREGALAFSAPRRDSIITSRITIMTLLKTSPCRHFSVSAGGSPAYPQSFSEHTFGGTFFWVFFRLGLFLTKSFAALPLKFRLRSGLIARICISSADRGSNLRRGMATVVFSTAYYISGTLQGRCRGSPRFWSFPRNECTSICND